MPLWAPPDEGQTSSAGGARPSAQRTPWWAAAPPAASQPGVRLPDLDVGGRAGLSEPAGTGKRCPPLPCPGAGLLPGKLDIPFFSRQCAIPSLCLTGINAVK